MRYSMQADTASRARRVATRRPMPQGGEARTWLRDKEAICSTKVQPRQSA